MRVLLTGSYLLQNVGDAAMMQVAARRVRRRWPSARVAALTDAPPRAAALLPGVEPIVVQRPTSQGRGGSWLRRSSRLLKRMVQQPSPVNHLAPIVAGLDLLIVCGMGGLNDAFARWAARLLDLLETAEQSGVPVALMGQGLGPLTDPAFTGRVARVLRGAGLIALRERLSGPALLDRLGVPPDVVRITGDDAVEPAYEARPTQIGTGLGINLRVADYAAVDAALVTTMREVLKDATSRLNARAIPIPISHRHGGLDAATNRALLTDINPGSDGGATLVTPIDVIRQTGRCRVVVTGSYHAGVFALSQGIPVVAIANSPYYADKFLGLANMFGCGCELVGASGPGFTASLDAAIDRAWMSADALRSRLLATAAEQVVAGNAAYDDLQRLAGQLAVEATA